MPDYTYLRPNDPAAEEAALVEAMHAQAAPMFIDMEFTFDAPPVQLVRPGELYAANARAEALALELDHIRPEWQAMRDERDQLRASQLARIAELEAWIDAIPTGALIDYYYGSEAINYDARQAVEPVGAWIRRVEDEIAQQMRPTEAQP